MKQLLLEDLIFVYPNFNLSFIPHTDLSGRVTDAVILQMEY